MKSELNSLLLSALTLLIFASSCKLDDTTISGVPPLLYNDLNHFAAENGTAFETFDLNTNSDQEVEGENGVKINIPANKFMTSNGDPVDGNVTFKMKEVLKKSDMVLSNITTEANGQILESIGTIMIDANQGENQLLLNDEIGITMQGSSTISDPTALNLYTANAPLEDGGAVSWSPNSTNTIPLNNMNEHAFMSDQLSWITLAKPMDNPNPVALTIIPNDVAEISYERGYIVFDDSPSVIALQQSGNTFVYNNFPSNKNATIIMTAMDPLYLRISILENVNINTSTAYDLWYSIVSEEEFIATIHGID